MYGLTGGILAATGVVEVAGISWSVIGVLGAVLAVGVIIFGASLGISRIACSATEAIARQPEAGGRIFTSMLLAAALIEGVTFFGLIVCFMTVLWLT